MKSDYILKTVIRPALKLLGDKYRSPNAEIMLLSIGNQESRFEHRVQINGPAHSFWQFELGGIRGVLGHHASASPAIKFCEKLEVNPSATDVYLAMTTNDELGAGFARLLLYTDPNPLPKPEETQNAWEYYLHNWRPGKPHRETWDRIHAEAVFVVKANP